MKIDTRMQNAAMLVCAGIVLGPGVGVRGQSPVHRLHDPVVLTGADVPAFLGKPVSAVGMLRYDSLTGAFLPVPFQIDETDGAGSYFGPKNGVLDPADEIVFLARDLGDSAPSTAWPDDEESRTAVRYGIGVQDGMAGSDTGWVGVYASSALAASAVDYITENLAWDKVTTPVYAIGHSAACGFQDSLVLRTEAGGDGLDIMDRQKVRLIMKLDGIDYQIHITEDMDSDITIIPGFTVHFRVKMKRVETTFPARVRMHRKMVMEIQANGSGYGYSIAYHDSLSFYTTFYPGSSVWTTGTMVIPDPAEGDFKEMRLSLDWNSNAFGMRFSNPYNTTSIRIDGFSDSPVKTLLWPGTNSYTVSADPTFPGAAIKHAGIVVITQLAGTPLGSTRTVYYKDDMTNDGSDTGDKRSYGDAGIWVSGSAISGSVDVSETFLYYTHSMNQTQASAAKDTILTPLAVAMEEQRLRYALSVYEDPPGSGSVRIEPASDTPFADSTVVLQADPNSGFVFDTWSGDLEGGQNPASLVMDGPKTVVAHFLALHEIVIDTDPSGFPVRVDKVSYSSPAVFIWTEGKPHDIGVDSLTAAHGGIRHSYSRWSDGGARTHTMTVRTADQTVTAYYAAQYFLNTSVLPPQGGTVLPSPPGKWVPGGTDAVVEAFPAADYVFIGWTGDVSGMENPKTILLTAPTTATANFGNYPPAVSAPDTAFFEDDTLKFSFAEILGWINDPNHPDSSLDVQLLGNGTLEAVPDSSRGIWLLSTGMPDWTGQADVVVTAVDPLGAAGRDTMNVEVLGVPDPPESFTLVEPVDETVFEQWPVTIGFAWETPQDPDPGEPNRYVFELDTTRLFNGGSKIRVDSLSSPDYAMPWPGAFGDRTYFWRVFVRDPDLGDFLCQDSVFIFSLATSVDDPNAGQVPADWVLSPNYPNPFNAETVIRFGAPRLGDVSISAFNTRGQLVRTLSKGEVSAGYHTMTWDGRDGQGRPIAAGVYLIVLRNSEAVRKIKTLYIP